MKSIKIYFIHSELELLCPGQSSWQNRKIGIIISNFYLSNKFMTSDHYLNRNLYKYF